MKSCMICGTPFKSKGRKLTCSDLCSKRLKQQRDFGFTLTLPRPHGSLRLWTRPRHDDDIHVGVYNREDGYFYTLCGSRQATLVNARVPRITCDVCRKEYERIYPNTRPTFRR